MSLSRKKTWIKRLPILLKPQQRLVETHTVSFIWNTKNKHSLVVSTPLKHISQNGNLPQVGVNIKTYLKPPTWTIHRAQIPNDLRKVRHPASLLFLREGFLCQVSGARFPLAAKRCKPGTWTLDGCCFCGPLDQWSFPNRVSKESMEMLQFTCIMIPCK